MTEPKDTWESVGEAADRIVARLEAEHRRAFEKQCREDGIKSKAKGEPEHARI